MGALVLGVMVLASNVQAAQCFQQYIRDVNSCSNLDSWVDRSACGLDAGLTLAGCVRGVLV
jgi:hypothetical protein